jgi:ketosteroid isomerase-like protein
MEATKAGHIDTVLSLMAEDIVLLVPGMMPMGKREFAIVAMAQANNAAPEIGWYQ